MAGFGAAAMLLCVARAATRWLDLPETTRVALSTFCADVFMARQWREGEENGKHERVSKDKVSIYGV